MSGIIDLDRCLLYEQLQVHLNELEPALREDVAEALSVEGKLLHQPASAQDGNWALLPFCLARDLNPRIDHSYACGVALAVECVVCATDLFDDAMDEDLTPLAQSLGGARMLNAALALLCLAQSILLSLADLGMPSGLLARLLDSLQRAILLAAAGQQQDLLAEGRAASELSREECIEIAARKAGALLSLACQLGAICAGVDEAQIVQCAEMGRLLGIAAQLDNDAHDLSLLLLPSARSALTLTHKSDLRRGKKTLPLVLAAHSLSGTRILEEMGIDAAFRQFAVLAGHEQMICAHAMHEGILTTWGIALLYRERAQDCLHSLESGISFSSALRQVLGLTESFATTEEW